MGFSVRAEKTAPPAVASCGQPDDLERSELYQCLGHDQLLAIQSLSVVGEPSRNSILQQIQDAYGDRLLGKHPYFQCWRSCLSHVWLATGLAVINPTMGQSVGRPGCHMPLNHTQPEVNPVFKETDFKIDDGHFHFKKDSYPLTKINDVKFRRLSLLDNLGQIIFWLVLFSGAVWLTTVKLGSAPTWLIAIGTSLSTVGFVFALFRCSRFALQVEFHHIDETGTQWITVAKSYSVRDGELLQKQADTLKQSLAQ